MDQISELDGETEGEKKGRQEEGRQQEEQRAFPERPIGAARELFVSFLS